MVLVSLSVIAVFFLLERDFLRHEKTSGRWNAGSSEAVDAEWLRKTIFSIRPEYVAVLWDERIDETKVATILSRLRVEEKLKVEDLGQDLGAFGDRQLWKMTRLVPLEHFSGVERALIDGLLYGGRESVTTAELREHYAHSPFNPVLEIQDPLSLEVDRLPGMGQKELAPVSFLRTFGLVSVSALLALGGMISTRELPSWFVTGILFGLMAMALSAVLAVQWIRRRLGGARTIRIGAGLLALVPAFMAVLPYSIISSTVDPGSASSEWFVSSLQLLGMACASSVFNLAKSRGVPSRMKKRHQVMRAREFFRRELRKDSPALEKDWAPYLVALGLYSEMEEWSKGFGVLPPSQ